VRLTYDGGRVTTWNGTVVIAGQLQRKLQKDLHSTELRAAPAKRAASPSPLLLVGLLAAVICAGGAIWLRRRRPTVAA
jgi:hypothetical protein